MKRVGGWGGGGGSDSVCGYHLVRRIGRQLVSFNPPRHPLNAIPRPCTWPAGRHDTTGPGCLGHALHTPGAVNEDSFHPPVLSPDCALAWRKRVAAL